MKLVFSRNKNTKGVTIVAVSTQAAKNRSYESANLSEKKEGLNFMFDQPKVKEVNGILYLDI